MNKPYVYIIQNKERTRWYVGYKQKPKAGEDYWGSSKYLKALIKKTGKENWTKTIVAEFDTWQEAKAHEDELLELMWDWPGRVNKAVNGYIDFSDQEVKEKHKSGCKTGAQKRSQDPVWRENHKTAGQELAQDPVWQANQKVGAQKRSENPEYRANQKAAVTISNKKRAKPFIATNIATGEEFYCESGYCDQVKVLGLTQGGISAFLRGAYPTPNYKGFTFRYA